MTDPRNSELFEELLRTLDNIECVMKAPLPVPGAAVAAPPLLRVIEGGRKD